MAVNKQPLTDGRDTSVSDQTHHAVPEPQQQQQQQQEPLSKRFMTKLAHNMHYMTFLPLILISVLGSIDILVAAVVSTALVCLILLLSFCCHKAGYVKVRWRVCRLPASCARRCIVYASGAVEKQGLTVPLGAPDKLVSSLASCSCITALHKPHPQAPP